MKLSIIKNSPQFIRSFSRVFYTTFQIDDNRVFLCCRWTPRHREKKCILCYSVKGILYTIATNGLAQKTNALKARVQTFTPQSHTCSYQQFSSKPSFKIATHTQSPSKMGSSHSLILTCKYATPTSYIYNSVLCWTKWPSSWLSSYTKR